MTKICTTIEQSEKLIELGLDVNTADLLYTYDFTFGGINGINVITPLFRLTEKDIPAWSLSALLELIPPYPGDYKDGNDFGFGKSMTGKWYSAHYLQTLPNGDIHSVKVVTGESAVDAAFEMVCWLKENGKI